MKITGVEIRTLETKEQRDWFYNLKHKMHQAFPVLSGGLARMCSDQGYELIEADGEIWAVEPDDNFKEIFGLNPVKSGTTHQHLAQEEDEGSDEFGDGGGVPAALRQLRTKPRGFSTVNGGGTPSLGTEDMNFSSALRQVRTKTCGFRTVIGEGIPGLGTEDMNHVRDEIRRYPNHPPNHKEEGEGSINAIKFASVESVVTYEDIFSSSVWPSWGITISHEVPKYMVLNPLPLWISHKAVKGRPKKYRHKLRINLGSSQSTMSLRPLPPTQLLGLLNMDEGERFNKLSVKDKQRYICEVPKPNPKVGDGIYFYMGGTSGSSTKNMTYGRSETSGSSTKNMKYGRGETSGSSTKNMKYGRGEVRGHPDQNYIRKNHFASNDEGNYEVGDGGFFGFGGTSGSSTKNMTYGHGETSGSSTENMTYGRGETSGSSTVNKNYGRAEEVRGHPDQNHIRKNYSAFDDDGKNEGFTEAMQKSFEAGVKQNIDNKNVNDEHVIDMPKGPDHGNKKEQANDGDGLFRVCEINLANTVSFMGSNPPPWATTPTSQRLLGFSGVANAVGYVGTTAALSLRYTSPRAARILAKVAAIASAWAVILHYTSYTPVELQWLGYVLTVLCSLAVHSSNY